MVVKLESRSRLLPVQPKAPAPRPLPQVRQPSGRDEMSTGAGKALRLSAEKRLGAAPFAGVGTAAGEGLRVNAFGGLSTQADLRLKGACPVAPVSTSDVATDAQITNNVIAELQALSAGGSDAAQLTAAAYASAVEQVRAQYPNMSAAERMDTAVAIATYALNGPGNLGDLERVDSGETSVVPKMRELEASGLVQWSNGGLDTTSGGGTLDPHFNDGTTNQAFHTNFFIAAGYVAGNEPGNELMVHLGNIYHETFDRNAWGDGGGSMADYAASATGMLIGSQLNVARDSAAQADAGLSQTGHNLDLLIPSIVHGGMSQAGIDPPRVDGMSDAQYQGSIEMAAVIQGYRDSPAWQLATTFNPVVFLPILFFQAPPALRKLLGG